MTLEAGSETRVDAQPIIDSCVQHGWRDQQEITAYMSPGWREYLGRPGLLPNGGGAISIAVGSAYKFPARPGVGREAIRAITDPADLRTRLFDRGLADHAVLGFDEGGFATALINPYLALEIARAANAWTLEKWLPADPRLFALMLVPTQIPTEAAAEIRRVGLSPRIVGVFLGGNGLGKSFGHPCYHPIYEAAAEMGLPIVIKAGGEAAVIDSPASVGAMGDPATYAEARIMESHSLMTHATSLITQGVFERFPSLKALLLGGGVLWVPPLLWRLDEKYKGLSREIPWVRRLPSEIFRTHIRVGTYPFDKAPTPALLGKALRVFDHIEDILCYASGVPSWDADEPAMLTRQLPEGTVPAILSGNATALFPRMQGVSCTALHSVSP